MQAIDYIFDYVYRKTFEFGELSEQLIEEIKSYRPRTQIEHFPEDFPDKEGYTGDYFTLYRGIFCKTEDEYEVLMECIRQGKGNLCFFNATSWTTSEAVAIEFAKGAGFYSYTNNYDFRGFKGVILEAPCVYKEQTFFSVYEAKGELELEYEDELQEMDYTIQYHEKEDEIVLLPGTYSINLFKTINLGE